MMEGFPGAGGDDGFRPVLPRKHTQRKTSERRGTFFGTFSAVEAEKLKRAAVDVGLERQLEREQKQREQEQQEQREKQAWALERRRRKQELHKLKQMQMQTGTGLQEQGEEAKQEEQGRGRGQEERHDDNDYDQEGNLVPRRLPDKNNNTYSTTKKKNNPKNSGKQTLNRPRRDDQESEVAVKVRTVPRALRKTKLTQFHTTEWLQKHKPKFKRGGQKQQSSSVAVSPKLLTHLKDVFALLPKAEGVGGVGGGGVSTADTRRDRISLRLLRRELLRAGLKPSETGALLACLRQPRQRDDVDFPTFIDCLSQASEFGQRSLQHQRMMGGALRQLLKFAVILERKRSLANVRRGVSVDGKTDGKTYAHLRNLFNEYPCADRSRSAIMPSPDPANNAAEAIAVDSEEDRGHDFPQVGGRKALQDEDLQEPEPGQEKEQDWRSSHELRRIIKYPPPKLRMTLDEAQHFLDETMGPRSVKGSIARSYRKNGLFEWSSSGGNSKSTTSTNGRKKKVSLLHKTAEQRQQQQEQVQRREQSKVKVIAPILRQQRVSEEGDPCGRAVGEETRTISMKTAPSEARHGNTEGSTDSHGKSHINSNRTSKKKRKKKQIFFFTRNPNDPKVRAAATRAKQIRRANAGFHPRPSTSYYPTKTTKASPPHLRRRPTTASATARRRKEETESFFRTKYVKPVPVTREMKIDLARANSDGSRRMQRKARAMGLMLHRQPSADTAPTLRFPSRTSKPMRQAPAAAADPEMRYILTKPWLALQATAGIPAMRPIPNAPRGPIGTGPTSRERNRDHGGGGVMSPGSFGLEEARSPVAMQSLLKVRDDIRLWRAVASD